MPNWPDLTRCIELEIPFGVDIRPGDAELDAFEVEFGVKLPEDYRLFMTTFGAGTIPAFGQCEFPAPGAPEINQSGRRDLAFHNLSRQGILQHHYDMAKNSPYGKPTFEIDAGWLDRLIFFCVAGDGQDEFAWQPGEITNAVTNDMNIYWVYNWPKNSLVLVAATFREFVMDYLLSGHYFRDSNPADPSHAIDYRLPQPEKLLYQQDLYGIDPF